jgi:diguanylate cyclase (GGDEF)-like protein/PAS domain S-box-containing protein
MKKTTLKSKIEKLISIILVVAIVSISIIVFIMSYSDIKGRFISESIGRIDGAMTVLAVYTEQVVKGLEVIDKQVQHGDQLSTAFQISQLNHHLEIVKSTIENATTLYVGTEEGKFYLYPLRYVPDDYDPRIRGWYKNSQKNKNSVAWTDPYMDIGTNELVITASKYFETLTGQSSGVIGIDINLNQISKMIQSTTIGKKGYVMLISPLEGIVVASPKTEDNGKSVQELYGNGFLSFLKSSDEIYESENRTYIKRTTPLLNTTLVAMIDKGDIYAIQYKLMGWIFIVALMVLLISEYFVLRLSKYITEPILKLCEVMDRVGEGDYYLQSDIQSNDEVGYLVTGFNNMLRNIKEKNEEMTALYEELYASEEALQSQYDELFTNREMIKKNEERYKYIFDISKEGLWELNTNNSVNYITKSWYSGFGIDVTKGILDDWTRLIHPAERKKVTEDLRQHVFNKTELYHEEYRVLTINTDYRWIESIAKARFDEEGHYIGLLGSHVDITKRKVYEERILEMAYIDTLTQLYNRTYIAEKLQEFIDKWGKGTFIFIDLDRFKHINDTYGHAAGDKVLVQLSERLKSKEVRLLARFSGDEFLLVTDHFAHDSDFKSFVNEILVTIGKPIYHDDMVFRTTASIGVSAFPRDSMQVEELIRRCDIAMYQAKKQNGNTYYVYDKGVESEAIKEIRLESNLKYAIENNELYLKYQPIIDIKRQRLSGFEALLRWNNPLLGEVYPDVFIPIAERTGLINEIGLFVLKEACLTMKKLNIEHETPYHIAVNISVIQLLEDRFVQNVLAIIEETGFKKDLIEFEITESVMLESNEEILAKLYYLRSKGIKLSLDDFGTGYSSINNLLKLPISYLKIDKQVVRDSVESDPVFTLMESVVSFAHKMNISVIAEGIENQIYLNKVIGLKADYVQGYFYEKPLLYEEIAGFIANSRIENKI